MFYLGSRKNLKCENLDCINLERKNLDGANLKFYFFKSENIWTIQIWKLDFQNL